MTKYSDAVKRRAIDALNEKEGYYTWDMDDWDRRTLSPALQTVANLIQRASDAAKAGDLDSLIVEDDPDPEEALLMEARQIAADWYASKGFYTPSTETLTGERDLTISVQCAFAALKRGRGLA